MWLHEAPCGRPLIRLHLLPKCGSNILQGGCISVLQAPACSSFLNGPSIDCRARPPASPQVQEADTASMAES